MMKHVIAAYEQRYILSTVSQRLSQFCPSVRGGLALGQNDCKYCQTCILSGIKRSPFYYDPAP